MRPSIFSDPCTLWSSIDEEQCARTDLLAPLGPASILDPHISKAPLEFCWNFVAPDTKQGTLPGAEHHRAMHFLLFPVSGILGAAAGKWNHSVLNSATCELAALVRDLFSPEFAGGGNESGMRATANHAAHDMDAAGHPGPLLLSSHAAAASLTGARSWRVAPPRIAPLR